MKPVLLAVDDDPQVLRAIRRDLRSRYAADYRILACSSGADALVTLDGLEAKGYEPCLFLVDQRMPGMTGLEFLLEAAARFPDAKRVLLTAYADIDAAVTAINSVRLDFYLTKPWDPPQDRLYPVLDDLLSDWRATHHAPYGGITVVGALPSPAVHAIRDFLARNSQPFRFLNVETGSEGARIADSHPDLDLPLVVFPDGEVLSAPGNSELAARLGLSSPATRPHYDLLIVGAGPAGLAAGVYGASEGLSTLLVEADVPGGQAGTSSLIENYLGFPSGLSGTDLARRAVTQARRFGAELLYPVRAVALRAEGAARIVTLQDGSEFSAETVLLATGVSYNKLDVAGADRFDGLGLYYGAAVTESEACVAQNVFVVGGANSSGQAALHFAKYAAKVTLLVRADSLEAGMSRYLINEIRRSPVIEVRTRTRIVELCGEDRLERVLLCDDRTGRVTAEPAGVVFAFIGARPHTDWLAGVVARDPRGFVLTGPDVPEFPEARRPALLETSVPGVFAAGDVRARSVKRVAASVGEGSMSVSLIHRYLADALSPQPAGARPSGSRRTPVSANRR